jgi:hypothetical protein
MKSLSNQRGASLPIVVVVTATLTAALAAALLMSSTDLRVNDDSQEQMQAFSLAESGREHFLVNRTALGFTASPPAASESTRVVMTDGYADLVLRLLRAQTGNSPAVYVLRSRGVRTRPTFPNVPGAERTVSQLVYWQQNPMHVPAGWTSLSGLHKNGASGSLDGNDACVPAAAPVAGVAVPTPPGFTGSSASVTGTPNIQDLGDAATAAEAVKIDWAGIVNGSVITPTLTIPPSAWPSFADPNYWPVIKIVGDYTLPSSGRGTLIVTGGLTISGAKTWDGAVLVGNNLTSNGNNTVNGATITGLNVKLGMTVPKGDVGNGNKTYRYNSCLVNRALQNVVTPALVPFANTWMDNWATY